MFYYTDRDSLDSWLMLTVYACTTTCAVRVIINNKAKTLTQNKNLRTSTTLAAPTMASKRMALGRVGREIKEVRKDRQVRLGRARGEAVSGVLGLFRVA